MIPETPITQFAKAYATDSTASTFTSYSAAVAIPPAAAGVTRVALDGWHQIPGSAAGKRAIVGRPAVAYRAAVPATVTYQNIVWQGDDYDKAQAMRNGEGWGQSDMIAAVEAILEKSQKA